MLIFLCHRLSTMQKEGQATIYIPFDNNYKICWGNGILLFHSHSHSGRMLLWILVIWHYLIVIHTWKETPLTMAWYEFLWHCINSVTISTQELEYYCYSECLLVSWVMTLDVVIYMWRKTVSSSKLYEFSCIDIVPIKLQILC